VNPSRSHPPRSAAFTLLEVILALAVSAIVLSVISTVFFGALQLRNRTSAAFDELLPLQNALTVMKRDLGSVLPTGGTFAGSLQTVPGTDATALLSAFGQGEPVSPVLHTASGRLSEFSPFGDVQKVVYFLIDATNYPAVGKDLVRVVSRNLTPAATEEVSTQWLMAGVESVRFQYLDNTAWTESWDSTTSSNLPAAIKVQIVLATEPDQENPYFQAPVELVVPIVVQAPAAVASTGGTP
jgi:general secretion pathway protein J